MVSVDQITISSLNGIIHFRHCVVSEVMQTFSAIICVHLEAIISRLLQCRMNEYIF